MLQEASRQVSIIFLSLLTHSCVGATLRDDTTKVELRGKQLHGESKDLPNLIWLPDLLEPAENFEKFFTKDSNKVKKVRNVHLLNYRNFGSSDHHESFELADMANDIIRYMDKNQITMATIGGHGFGAKVALATATDNLNRFTGVMCLDGGPVDNRHHPIFTELKGYVTKLAAINLSGLSAADLHKSIDKIVEHKKYNQIFKQAINASRGSAEWNFNMKGLATNMSKNLPDVASWHESYGLWPGRAWALFGAYSPWVHLSTNTLPFYWTMPRLEGQFGTSDFNIFGNDESPNSHWLHETTNEEEQFHLSNRMWRWLKQKDGVHVLLNDRTEVGWNYIPDRGTDTSVGTGQGEYIPEHVHHNYRHTSKNPSASLFDQKYSTSASDLEIRKLFSNPD